MGIPQLAKKGWQVVLLAACIVGCVAALPSTAHAWDSYSGITEWIGVSPLHEDMTQMAYVRIVKEGPVGDPNSILYIDPADPDAAAATYKENLYYLRQGAYWNDVPANTGYEFGRNYLIRDKVPLYDKAANYGSAYDIGVHMAMAAEALNGTDIDFTAKARAGVRMSHNMRGNILHSMLGIDADGTTYLTQEQQRAYSLQWLEAAYKYVNNETLTDQEALMIAFIDPYNQLLATLEEGTVPAEGAYDDADRQMTTKQMRLRALGMMCHTIEDSYNPAHTIRSYQGDAAGPILAFGVYEIQAKHADYDHTASIDQEVREDFVSNTGTLAGAQGYVDPAGKVDSLTTLSLKEAADAAHTLLEFYQNGTKWDEGVEEWLTDTVFACNFADASAETATEGLYKAGGSYIYEGGRRMGSTGSFIGTGVTLMGEYGKIDPDVSETLIDAGTAYVLLDNYQRDINNLFHANRGSTYASYPYHAGDFQAASTLENQGFSAACKAFDSYYGILVSSEDPDINGKLAKLNPTTRMKWADLVRDTNGIIQEFYLDFTGATSDGHTAETVAMLKVLDMRTGTVSGSVEYVAGNEFVLRLANDNGSMLFTCGSGVDPSALAAGQQNVSVDYEIAQDGAGSLFTYTATKATPATGGLVYDAKGIVQSFTGDSLTLLIDGTNEWYTFALKGKALPDGISQGAALLVRYSVSEHALAYEGGTVLDRSDPKPLTGVITRYYGNIVFVLPDGDDDFRSEVAFEFGNADFIGSLGIGQPVEVLYFDPALPQGFTDETSRPSFGGGDESRDPIYVYEASRIKVGNHVHSDPLVCTSNGNATHTAFCVDLDFTETRNCTAGTGGTCPDCGYVFGKYRISGKVVDSAIRLGIPATVQLYDKDGNKVGSAITAASDGTFAFDNVYEGYGYAVKAFKAGYAGGASDAFNLIGGNAALGDISLAPDPNPMVTYRISGVITDEATGSPIRAIVQLRDSVGSDVVPAVQAAADGSYTIPDVVSGSGYVLVVVMPGYISQTLPAFDVLDADITGMDVALSPKVGPMEVYVVSGTVSDEATGEGLPAQVQLKNAAGENVEGAVMASADGSYAIPHVLPGVGYTVEAGMPGYTSATCESFAVVDGNVTNRDVKLSSAPVVVPVLTTGDGSKWYKGSRTGLLFVSSADFETYTGTWVDGKKLVEGRECKATAGSIRVMLEPAFLETLAEGTHTVKVGSAQGDVEGTFEILKGRGPVATGDSIPLAALAAVGGIAALLMLYAAFRMRRSA